LSIDLMKRIKKLQKIKIMTTLGCLTVGTKLQMPNQSGTYGTYSNMIVSRIEETKSGRLMVYYTYTFTYKGKIENLETSINHSALSKKTRLIDYGYSI